MSAPSPASLALNDDDRRFLLQAAERVLASTSVAATTAAGLISLGIDARRVDALIPWHSVAVALDDVVFKKVEPDAESPSNFGLFVRRKLAE